MAQLLDLQDVTPGPEKAAEVCLAISEWAAKQRDDFPLRPEIKDLLDLDRRLPEPLQILRGAARRHGTEADPPPGPSSTWLRTLEASTPLLRREGLKFSVAAALADDRCKWDLAAPQMKSLGCLPELPADGARWRGRLQKRTELLKPIADGLATQETIEMHGDDSGTSLRIHKRVRVRLPQELDEKYGGILSLGLATLLWTWALGLLDAADEQAPSLPPSLVKQPGPPTQEDKKSVPNGDEVSVAVLGGGPAGLACAWLLSKPPRKGTPACPCQPGSAPTLPPPSSRDRAKLRAAH